MADVNRGDRPLSPHLSIYRPQWTSMLSITHRATGVGMTLGALLIVWWLLGVASGGEYFAMVDGVLTSWIGLLILFGTTWALWFHLLNGIRHLVWDTGRGFDIDKVEASGKAIAGGSIAMTVLTWLVIAI